MTTSFPQPKFEVGQSVRFTGDHPKEKGVVMDIIYDSNTGFSYRISSKYYDIESNDMVEGIKFCTEDELVDMTEEESELS